MAPFKYEIGQGVIWTGVPKLVQKITGRKTDKYGNYYSLDRSIGFWIYETSLQEVNA